MAEVSTFKKILAILPLFLFDIILPTVDVGTDVVLISKLYNTNYVCVDDAYAYKKCNNKKYNIYMIISASTRTFVSWRMEFTVVNTLKHTRFVQKIQNYSVLPEPDCYQTSTSSLMVIKMMYYVVVASIPYMPHPFCLFSY